MRRFHQSSFENHGAGAWTPIGAGSFGQVYKTRHHGLKKDVAVKSLGPLGDNSEQECLHEADLMQTAAKGPYIMHVLGVFVGCIPLAPTLIQVCLVMDVMERGSLDFLQRNRKHQPLPWPLVFRLVHQVAEGMKYLHSLTPALIHKDLKPQNILLDSDLNVKITDFGLAKFDNTATAAPLKGFKTEFFAPPEAFGEVSHGGATCAFDVYSYAILVWTILNPAYKIERGEVSYSVRPSLEAVNRMEVPGLERLVQLMVTCWHQSPKKRPTFAECTAVTERLYDENKPGINDSVSQVKEEQDAILREKERKRDFQRLTLDTNTTHRRLSLSENNRKVTRGDQVHSYPDHHERFDVYPQVLCSESLTGRCYWEVEWSGRVGIAVTYRGITRKGPGLDRWLGYNDKSWRLDCYGSCYSVQHNSEGTRLPVSPSVSNRLDEEGRRVYIAAVYLDHPAGTLSFYEVSSDTRTHLYTFQTSFTEPLYAGFWVWGLGRSVRLCEQI